MFPAQALLQPWTNKLGQIQLLTHAVRLTPELFTRNRNARKYITEQNTNNYNTHLSIGFVTTALNSAWNNIDLVQLMIELWESYPTHVSTFFAIAVSQSPDVLLLTLSHLHVYIFLNLEQWNSLSSLC